MQQAMIREHAMSVGYPLPAPEYPDGVIVWDPCRDFVAMPQEVGFQQESIEWYEANQPVLARCLLTLRKPAAANER